MLFKILHGEKSRISTDITPYHEGYCYVTHDGDFYVDMNNERVKLNAKDAETIGGVSLVDAMEPLAPYTEYWWLGPDSGYRQVETSTTAYFSYPNGSGNANTVYTYYYGKTLNFDEKTGKYSIANPSILTMDYNCSTNNWTALKGNYYTYGAQETETAWFLNSNATSSGSQSMNSGSPYAYIQVKASPAIKYTSEQIESSTDVSTYIAYSSTDPNAYSAEDGFIALGTIKDKVLDLALEAESTPKYDVVTVLNNSETEIPTSSAVYKAIETQTGMANVFATATIL